MPSVRLRISISINDFTGRHASPINCNKLQPKKRGGGLSRANALHTPSSTSIPSRSHSIQQSNPLHSANCPPYRLLSSPLSPRAKRNDSVRRRRGREGEERAKCRQTMNDISPLPSFFPLSFSFSEPRYRHHHTAGLLASLVPSPSLTDDYCFYNTTALISLGSGRTLR